MQTEDLTEKGLKLLNWIYQCLIKPSHLVIYLNSRADTAVSDVLDTTDVVNFILLVYSFTSVLTQVSLHNT